MPGGKTVRGRSASRGGASDGLDITRAEGVREAMSRLPATLSGLLVVGGAADVVGVRLPPGGYEPPPFAGHSLTLSRAAPHRLAWRAEGRAAEVTVGTGDVVVFPAGQTYEYEVGEPADYLSVVLREGFVGRIAERAGADPARLQVLSGLSVRDPQLRCLVASFLPELEGGGLGGELYVEALASQLAVHLLRHHSSLGRRHAREVDRVVPAGPAPKRSISRALDYLNDNLAGKPSLEGMAEAAGYSPHHFARLFRETTGLPPHQYVIQQRVEKAKGLLVRGVAVGEVARLVGFSDQGHLARHFRRSTGLTPTDFR